MNKRDMPGARDRPSANNPVELTARPAAAFGSGSLPAVHRQRSRLTVKITSTPTYDELVTKYQQWDSDRLLVVAQAGQGEYTGQAIEAARHVLLAAQPSDCERRELQEAFHRRDQERPHRTVSPPRMPLFIKLLTAQGAFAALMILWVVIPGEKEVNGRAVSYGEFWASGDAMVFLLTFGVHAFCACCFIKKIGIGRHVYLGMWVVAATLGGWLTGFGFC
jgi:hypothetical protein